MNNRTSAFLTCFASAQITLYAKMHIFHLVTKVCKFTMHQTIEPYILPKPKQNSMHGTCTVSAKPQTIRANLPCGCRCIQWWYFPVYVTSGKVIVEHQCYTIIHYSRCKIGYWVIMRISNELRCSLSITSSNTPKYTMCLTLWVIAETDAGRPAGQTDRQRQTTAHPVWWRAYKKCWVSTY